MQPEAHSTTAAALAVDIRKFPWVRRVAADYAFAYERVAPFYAGNPADPGAWADAIVRTRAHLRAPADVAAIIAAQQARRDAPPEARRAAERLADPKTVVVVTGQQAGLFGGPLFTLLKALTAMRLAAEVSTTHKVTALPLFWIDAEDHDWPEVNGCTVLDAGLEPHTIRLPDLPGAGDLPIARLALTDDIAAALDALAAALPPTAFTSALIGGLRGAYRPGIGMAEAFGRWIETVLGPRGLVVFDSSDPAAKPLVQDVFARELANPGTTARLATEAGRQLVARGYHAQVMPSEGAVSLFYLNDGRHAVHVSGATATVGDRVTTLRALADEARRTPQHFSPNVLLRPIVQDTLFPTICYVSGPNELGYLGQLREVYDHVGLPMPLIYPRATATLADSAMLRFLTKYDVPLVALQAHDEATLNRLLADQLPPTVERALSTAAAAIEARMAEVAREVPQIDPTLSGAVQSTLGRMQREMGTLHGKVIQAAKRRDDTLRRQFEHARALAFPLGRPQERELGFVWFLNRYGPALVDRLLDDLPLEMGHHWILAV